MFATVCVRHRITIRADVARYCSLSRHFFDSFSNISLLIATFFIRARSIFYELRANLPLRLWLLRCVPSVYRLFDSKRFGRNDRLYRVRRFGYYRRYLWGGASLCYYLVSHLSVLCT
jgi:hypothetical protein